MSRSGRFFFALFTVCTAVVIQSTWAVHWRAAGAQSDLVLTVVLLFGVMEGPRRAALQGFFAGFLCGVFAGASLGSFIASRSLTGYLVGLAQGVMVRDNPLVAWVCVFAGTLVAEAVFFMMNPVFPLPSWALTVLKEAVWNTLLSIPLYPALLHFLRPRRRSDTAATAPSRF